MSGTLADEHAEDLEALRELLTQFAGRAFKLVVVEARDTRVTTELAETITNWTGATVRTADLDTMENPWQPVLAAAEGAGILVTAGLRGPTDDVRIRCERLNVQRDLFARDLRIPWVLVVPPEGARALADHAPDFSDFVALWIRESRRVAEAPVWRPDPPELPPIPEVDLSTWAPRLAEGWSAAAEGRVEDATDALARYDVGGGPASPERSALEALITRLQGGLVVGEALSGRHRAAAALDRGDVSEALAATEADPGDAAMRVRALLAADRYEEALAAAETPLLRASVELRLGRSKPAHEELAGVEGPPAALLDGIALAGMGRFDEARDRLFSALHADVWTALAAGTALITAPDLTDAEMDRLNAGALRWQGLRRREVRLWELALAERTLEGGQAEAALRVAERIEQEAMELPLRQRARVLQANALMSSGRAAEAERRLREWLGQDPDDENLLRTIVNVLSYAGARDQAVPYLEHQFSLVSSRLGKDAAAAQVGPQLAEALASVGEDERADMLGARSLAVLYDVLGPDAQRTLGARLSLALVRVGQGRFAEAESLARPLVVGPPTPRGRRQVARLTLADSLRGQGRWGEAEALYQLVAKSAEDEGLQAHAMLGLAGACRERDEAGPAATLASSAVRKMDRAYGSTSPRSLAARLELASALMAAGRLTDAGHELDVAERILGAHGLQPRQRIKLALLRLECAHLQRDASAAAEQLRALAPIVLAARLPESELQVLADNLADLVSLHANALAKATREILVGLPPAQTPSRLRLLSVVARAEGRSGHFERAEGPLRRALDIALHLGDPSLIAAAEADLGQCLAERKKYAEAEPHLRASLDASAPAARDWTITVLGRVLGDTGRTDEAVELLLSPLSAPGASSALNVHLVRASQLAALAPAAARAHAQAAVDLARARTPPDPALLLLTELAGVTTQRPPPRKALKVLRHRAHALPHDTPGRAEILRQIEDALR